MLKNYFLSLCLFLCVGTTAQKKGILLKYKKEFTTFDSLNNLKDDKTKLILLALQKTTDFNTNDTLKTTVYSCWLAFHMQNRDIKNVNKYHRKCESLAIKKKLYSRACACTHNKAVMYHYADKIDSSLIFEKKALQYAKLAKDTTAIDKSIVAISKKLTYQGKYKESNNILESNLKTIKDPETKGVGLLTVASNYRELGSNIDLNPYFKKAIFLTKKAVYKSVVWSAVQEYCNYLLDRKEYKKTLIYADSITYFSKIDNAVATSKYYKARAFLGLKNFDEGIANINVAIALDTKNYDAYSLVDDYKVRGQLKYENGSETESIVDFAKSKKLFSEAQDVALEVDVLKYNILANLKNKDSSIFNDFERYVILKDSIYNQENIRDLTKFEVELRTADKELQIKTQQLELQKEKVNKYMAFGGIGVLVLLSSSGFLWFRNQQKQTVLKTQNTLLGLQQDLVAAELSNLNKQLDPHEIKNLLASISPEIQEKAPESYRKMLKLFNLTKASLNSSSITDTIENQLQQIDDFLSLEKNMLSVTLHYNIENNVQTQHEIPRFLLKNLVENSLKHGIKKSDIGGEINIKLSSDNDFIFIEIDDTGIGRKQAISLDSGIGTTTYQKLFATLNPKNKDKATFEIIDKQLGTKVEVKIPANYKYS